MNDAKILKEEFLNYLEDELEILKKHQEAGYYDNLASAIWVISKNSNIKSSIIKWLNDEKIAYIDIDCNNTNMLNIIKSLNNTEEEFKECKVLILNNANKMSDYSHKIEDPRNAKNYNYKIPMNWLYLAISDSTCDIYGKEIPRNFTSRFTLYDVE